MFTHKTGEEPVIFRINIFISKLVVWLYDGPAPILVNVGCLSTHK